jgi:tRNA threonylcarbamoyladenosine biosynthesis protein TsaB
VRILAFDTATRATTVALSGTSGGVLESRDDPVPGERPGHVSRLLPLIAEVLDRGQLEFADLDRIAVGVGPGTFTGLRIGIATARALAAAASCPLVGVSTLHSLALEAEDAPEAAGVDAVAAILDARRREVFAAVWRLDGAEAKLDRVEAMAPRAVAPAELSRLLQDSRLRLLAVGDGAVEFRGVLERSGALIPPDESALHRVTAAAHLRLAEQLPPASPDQIQPEYLRAPDVREPSSPPAPGRS